MYYKTMLSILAKSLIISFQYNIESVYLFYSNPVYIEWAVNVRFILDGYQDTGALNLQV